MTWASELDVSREVSGVKANDDFVGKAILTGIEEVAELSLEVVEEKVDQICLYLWWELLIEIELFNDQVVVILERFLDRFTDVKIEASRDVQVADCRIGLLELLDPHIQIVVLVHQKTLEVFLWGH